MKKLMTLAIAGILGIALSTQIASGKPKWKTALGAADCKVCHDDKGKKEENAANAKWAKAKDMAAKLAKAEGDYAGKTSCNDCHKGQMVPPKP